LWDILKQAAQPALQRHQSPVERLSLAPLLEPVGTVLQHVEQKELLVSVGFHLPLLEMELSISTYAQGLITILEFTFTPVYAVHLHV
jgi:hypothetical protein